ncbi:pPIWI_RE module domain-containing protein [Sediminitomix flava]|uniref:Uncharacterized protein DUF3893 n=1 Tax=Sediminitomix flava TaxID=379075 RepID=A0A315YXV8_SEDFL|nr:DUF3962 domain-containing protein [Sediminitomix flava]PWJ34962.1 uncharacterized protein DUF3893 [Sediminitomix flava]
MTNNPKKGQPMAFHLLDDCQELKQVIWTLQFPLEWQGILDYVIHKEKDSESNKRLPIRSLNQILKSLIPNIFATNDYTETVWLYCKEPIPNDLLLMFVQIWVKASFKTHPLVLVLDRLKADDLQWEPLDVDFSNLNTSMFQNENNHRIPDYIFDTLPHIIANYLVQSTHEKSLTIYDDPLRFKKIHSDNRNVQLVSWPPLYDIGYKEGRYYYSYYISFSLYLSPYQEKPEVVMTSGIKRYLSNRFQDTYSKNKRSVIIDPKMNWPVKLSDPYSLCSISYKYDHDKSEVVPDGLFLEILQMLQEDQKSNSIPDYQTILSNVDRYINRYTIVYKDNENAHGIGKGLSPADRKNIFEPVRDRLNSIMKPTPALPVITLRKNLITKKEAYNPFFNKKADVDLHQQRVEIVKNVRSDFRLNVLMINNSSPLRHTIVDELITLFGGQWEEESKTFTSKNLSITLSFELIGEIIEGEVKSTPEVKIQKEIIRKAKEQALKRYQGFNACIIEILPPKHYSGRIDPKNGIKEGFAKAGLLSKFIIRDDANINHKSKAAILALLTQHGVTVPKLNFMLQNNDNSFPKLEEYIGVYILKRTFPCLVKVNTITREVRVKTLYGKKGWKKYNNVLIELAHYNWEKHNELVNPIQLKSEFSRWIIEEIRNIQSVSLWMCLAENLRSTWKILQDQNLPLDHIGENPTELYPIAELNTKVRLIRLRHSENCKIMPLDINDEIKRGKGGGIYIKDERILYTVAQSPSTDRSNMATTRKDNIKDNHQLQQPLEIALFALQEEDKKNVDQIPYWAEIIERLRKANLAFGEATILPLPLHLAKKMNDYIFK